MPFQYVKISTEFLIQTKIVDPYADAMPKSSDKIKNGSGADMHPPIGPMQGIFG